MMISIGHRTGMFDTMASLRPFTSQQIADESGLQERYVREWHGAMVNDALLDLDQPIEVTVNGHVAFSDNVRRSAAAIWNSLLERLDPTSAASCELVLSL